MADIHNMNGKVVLVTGATSGIGLVAAGELAGMGATVVLAGRSPQKMEAALQAIRARFPAAQVEGLLADLSVQAQVRKLAEDFKARHNRLDVLLNNAGEIFMTRRESADGIEQTFALNHLAYFLLTHLLLDVLKASAPARIVNVSSDAHRGQKLNFADLEMKQGYAGWKQYGRTKLMNILFTRELARRLDGSGVTANALHPGFVATDFGFSNGGIWKPIFRLAQLGAISPEQGAKTSIYLASSPQVEGVSGKYFTRSRAVSPSPQAQDDAAAQKLWEISLKLTGLG